MKLHMGTIARIHWMRALTGGFLAEVALFAIVIREFKVFGPHVLPYVVPPAAMATCFLFALWVGRRPASLFILHGEVVAPRRSRMLLSVSRSDSLERCIS